MGVADKSAINRHSALFQLQNHEGFVHPILVAQTEPARAPKPETRVVGRMSEKNNETDGSFPTHSEAFPNELAADALILKFREDADRTQTHTDRIGQLLYSNRTESDVANEV